MKRDVNLHERSCRYNVNNSPNKTYKCRRCSATFVNRRELYNHRVSQHGGAEQNGAQNFQLVAPPWKDAQGNVVDQGLERVYNDNALHILPPHRTVGPVIRTYNFPTENL